MAEITSPNNPKIKLVRTLQTQTKQRKNQTTFVAEGVRLVEDAISAKFPFDYLLFDNTLSDRGKALLSHLSKVSRTEIYEVPPKLMAQISDTQSSQGILAVMKGDTLPLPKNPTFILIADQIRDPGNLGTILRTAQATGVEAVVLTPGTVDAFSPKVVRAGMGAHFRLPITHLPWHEIHAYLKGIPVFLAEVDLGVSLWEADFRKPCGLLIGGEAFGASSMGEELATHQVTIPITGGAESLNAAVAAAILMAEVLRQRSQGSVER